MHEHEPDFRSRGARVVAVGQGTGDQAAEFCRRFGVDARIRCLGDPDRAAYRAFGLERASFWGITGAPLLENPQLGLRRLRHADLRAAALPSSDVRQLGGVAVVDRDGVVRFLHRATKTDDFPAVDALLRVLDALPAAGS